MVPALPPPLPLTPPTRLPFPSQDDELLAYQIAFDLVENELQSFLQQVQAGVEELAPKAPAPAAAPPEAEANGDAMQTDVEVAGAAEVDEAAVAAAAEYSPKLQRLRDVLSGKTPIGLYLEFLNTNNKADLQVGLAGWLAGLYDTRLGPSMAGGWGCSCALQQLDGTDGTDAMCVQYQSVCSTPASAQSPHLQASSHTLACPGAQRLLPAPPCPGAQEHQVSSGRPRVCHPLRHHPGQRLHARRWVGLAGP